MASDLVYAIPPYLLNTSHGLVLQRHLRELDENVAFTNVVPASSPNYVSKPDDPMVLENQVTDDPILNKIIRTKLLYKLSVLGVLGSRPMEEFTSVSDEYLYELWIAFKQRLVGAGDSLQLSSSRVGEIELSPEVMLVPEQYVPYLDKTLRELVVASKQNSWHSYRVPRSFLKFDATVFDYTLPISWSPLISVPSLVNLEKHYGMTVANDAGFSSINLTSAAPSGQNDKHYLFVTDKEVPVSAGIFYYELEVIQEATAATDHQTLIEISDAALSSETSLHFWMGCTKSKVQIELLTKNGAPAINSSARKLDLETIKQDIYYSRHSEAVSPISDDLQKFLAQRPGTLRGSYVVSFEDSKFHNSIRGAEATQRLAVLNMNRRLSQLSRQAADEFDHGNVELEVPFNTNITKLKNHKLFRTDVIGYGINFIDKSFFITLNGVLIRTIPHEDIVSRLPAGDNIFDDKDDTSVYPLIGFELRDFSEIKAGPPSTSEIRTNFGFREFKFNIDAYVKKLKADKQRLLQIAQLKLERASVKAKNGTLDAILKRVGEGSSVTHDLIKQYLNHEGYVATFDAFDNDIRGADATDSSDLKLQTHAYNRQLIRTYLQNNQLDEVIALLRLTYSGAFNSVVSRNILFELYFCKYIYLLKAYLDSEVLGPATQAFQVAYQLGKFLQKEYKGKPDKIARLNEVSKVLIARNVAEYPRVEALIANYPKMVAKLQVEINENILSSLGFSRVSDLEEIVSNLGENINKLTETQDPQFVLVNYERDYLDL